MDGARSVLWDVVRSGFAPAAILLSAIIITYSTVRWGIPAGLAVGALPFVVLLLLALLLFPRAGLISLYVAGYLVIPILRYTNILGFSVVIDVLIMITFISILINSLLRPGKHQWPFSRLLLAMGLVWGIYCALELFNPTAQFDAWLLSRGLIYHFVAVTVLTCMVFKSYTDIRTILYLLSILTLVGVVKAIIQKEFGFDGAEWAFLNAGAAKTHLLATGTRYFSIYASAGIFGVAMGYAVVLFLIAALYAKSVPTKIYFVIVVIAAFYGLIISGTRGALAVPGAGFILFMMLSKKLKVVVPSAVVIVVVYFLLAHTMIGQSNQYVRRSRTLFDPNEPSLVVRKNNQKILANYLKNKPFGEGLGLSGVDAKPISQRFTTSVPTDSWYVKIWVETGVVGLILHLFMYGFVMAYGVYQVLFGIKDKILRGVISAMLCALFGVLVSSYGNQVLGQYPISIMVYVSIGFIFMARRFNKQIEDEKSACNGVI